MYQWLPVGNKHYRLSTIDDKNAIPWTVSRSSIKLEWVSTIQDTTVLCLCNAIDVSYSIQLFWRQSIHWKLSVVLLVVDLPSIIRLHLSQCVDKYIAHVKMCQGTSVFARHRVILFSDLWCEIVDLEKCSHFRNLFNFCFPPNRRAANVFPRFCTFFTNFLIVFAKCVPSKIEGHIDVI